MANRIFVLSIQPLLPSGLRGQSYLADANRAAEAGSVQGCSTMGWERRGGKDYYYRKVRRGGHVVTEYIGQGEAAHLAASIDRFEKRQREEIRKAKKKARAQEERAEDALKEFAELVQAITRAYLITRGYHLHKGEWRHKREKD